MLNKATLMGRIGKKDVKTLKNGGQMTALSLATTRKYRDSSGEKQTVTTWHNINCFSKLAEIAEKYVHVGDLVYIEGEINNKKIEQGDRAGNWVYSLTASEIHLIPSNAKKSGDSSDSTSKTKKESTLGYELEDDSIPF